MILHFNVTGESRKKMVGAIEEETGERSEYLRVPSCAYRVGKYKVGKDGELECPDGPREETAAVIERCVLATGVSPAEWSENEPGPEMTQSEGAGFTVSFPADGADAGNLTKLLEAKGNLIKKALSLDALPVEVTDEKITFPWWDAVPETPEEINAYTNFLSALCRMSREQKRITAKEKKVENEKYAFRCFLLRLGFIGAEYKEDRKILLRNLTGSSAFRKGRKKSDDISGK